MTLTYCHQYMLWNATHYDVPIKLSQSLPNTSPYKWFYWWKTWLEWNIVQINKQKITPVTMVRSLVDKLYIDQLNQWMLPPGSYFLKSLILHFSLSASPCGHKIHNMTLHSLVRFITTLDLAVIIPSHVYTLSFSFPRVRRRSANHQVGQLRVKGVSRISR